MVKSRGKIKVVTVSKSWKCHLKVCVLRDRWMWFCVNKASVLECMNYFSSMPVHPPLHLPDSSSCSEPLVTKPSPPSQCKLLQDANSEGRVPQTDQVTEQRGHGKPVVIQRPEYKMLFPCLHAEHPIFSTCLREHTDISKKSLRKLASCSGCLLAFSGWKAGMLGNMELRPEPASRLSRTSHPGLSGPEYFQHKADQLFLSPGCVTLFQNIAIASKLDCNLCKKCTNVN